MSSGCQRSLHFACGCHSLALFENLDMVVHAYVRG
jgi:hypothetical protein